MAAGEEIFEMGGLYLSTEVEMDDQVFMNLINIEIKQKSMKIQNLFIIYFQF